MNEQLKLLILFSSVIAGGGLVLFTGLKNQKFQKLILSFSGAFILALCLFHLFPEVYEGMDHETAGLMIFAGFLLQLILDYFSGGIEHGHVHIGDQNHHHHGHNHEHEHHHHPVMKRFPYVMMIGLCIHAFMEGLPLFTGKAGEGLFTGILFHNIPISFTLVNIFLMAGKTRKQSLIALAIFALMTPLGAIASGFIPGDPEVFGHYALALVIGIFFHISTTILFESDQNHQFNLMKFVTIILGSAAAFMLH
jgi:zinc and cadmium transporter